MLCFILFISKWIYIVYLPMFSRVYSLALEQSFNILRPRQNGRHFADDTFKSIFFNENVIISIKFSLKFVPNGPINNIPALAQIMAWRRPGDNPLSEAMMAILLTHICVIRPHWDKGPSASEVTLKDMANFNWYQITLKHLWPPFTNMD